jgi:hypothetical protein
MEAHLIADPECRADHLSMFGAAVILFLSLPASMAPY